MLTVLSASDGHRPRAYCTGTGRWGLLVVQEIFGVNAHIRSLCERFADQGFRVLSPLLFDRVDPSEPWGIELDYSQVKQGQSLARQVGPFEAPLLDLQACLEDFPPEMPVAVVGYCWGGSLAWLSAQRLPRVKAAVGYYGGGISGFLDSPPRAPVMLHFGDADPYVRPEEIAKIQRAYPDIPIHIYAAGHGFNCELRADYQAEAAALAWRRSLDFLHLHLLGSSVKDNSPSSE